MLLGSASSSEAISFLSSVGRAGSIRY
jgi:hypothetical protein